MNWSNQGTPEFMRISLKIPKHMCLQPKFAWSCKPVESMKLIWEPGGFLRSLLGHLFLARCVGKHQALPSWSSLRVFPFTLLEVGICHLSWIAELRVHFCHRAAFEVCLCFMVLSSAFSLSFGLCWQQRFNISPQGVLILPLSWHQPSGKTRWHLWQLCSPSCSLRGLSAEIPLWPYGQ